MATKVKKINYRFLRITLIVLGIYIFYLLIINKFLSINFNDGIQNKSIYTIISPTPNPAINKYHSKIMDISFITLSGYYIKEFAGSINLKNNRGSILISMIGTNNDSLEGYLSDIADYNKYTLTNKTYLVINDLPTIKVDINGIRHYLVYKNNRVFSIETKNPELYSDIDQIARSFRYEP